MRLDSHLIRSFPKIELHVHVEACLSSVRIEELAGQLRVPMLRPADQLFLYSTLADFLETYEWWCDLLRTPEIAEQLAYDAAAQLAADGIVYAEVLTGPKYWRHLSYDTLIEALSNGFNRAYDDGHADCRLLPSISREQSADWAMELVEWIGSRRPERVVGLGLDGNEAVIGRTSPKFEQVYARAAELGLGLTVHAGESSGPEGVRDALDYLHVDRIDHGVRAIEDAAVVRRLAKERVTLNVCPTSNVIIGLYPNLAAHPIGRLIEAGVPVTVNSDDPTAMNLTVSGEFLAVGRELEWSFDDVARATYAAIDAAFCDADCAQKLRSKVDAFLAALPNSAERAAT